MKSAKSEARKGEQVKLGKMLCPVDMAGPQSRLMQQVDQFQSTQVHLHHISSFLPHLVWTGWIFLFSEWRSLLGKETRLLGKETRLCRKARAFQYVMESIQFWNKKPSNFQIFNEILALPILYTTKPKSLSWPLVPNTFK